jgi:hypothetical protein
MIMPDGTRVNWLRKWALAGAEITDAWRVIPRAVLIGYGLLVWHLTKWFLEIPQVSKTECNADMIKVLLANNVDLEKAQAIACSAVEIIGGPTVQHTAFVTAICGLATVIFSTYSNTGRKWQENPFKFWGRRGADVVGDKTEDRKEVKREG